jgi:hypothetical protein
MYSMLSKIGVTRLKFLFLPTAFKKLESLESPNSENIKVGCERKVCNPDFGEHWVVRERSETLV